MCGKGDAHDEGNLRVLYRAGGDAAGDSGEEVRGEAVLEGHARRVGEAPRDQAVHAHLTRRGVERVERGGHAHTRHTGHKGLCKSFDCAPKGVSQT